MSTQAFFHVTDPDDPAAVDELLAFADLQSADLGRVLQTFRPWPSRTTWLVLGGMGLASLLPLLIPGEVGWGLS